MSEFKFEVGSIVIPVDYNKSKEICNGYKSTFDKFIGEKCKVMDRSIKTKNDCKYEMYLLKLKFKER